MSVTTEPWQCEGCGWTNVGHVRACDGCGESRATAVVSRAAALARLTTAETERSQWEQRAESANRRMDEASAEAMQANLRAAAAEARVGMSPEWRFWEGRAETAEARVEAAVSLLAREMYANEGIHMAEDDKAAWDDDALLTDVYDEYLSRARTALACPPQQRGE